MRKKLLESEQKFTPLFMEVKKSRDDKQSSILPWWKYLHNEIISNKITVDKIKEAILGSAFYFRHGMTDLLKTAYDKNIKFHIVSAGVMGVINQSINLLLNQNFPKETYENISKNIICCGTEEIYDKNNTLTNFKDPVITSLNKSMLVTHQKLPHIEKGSNAIIIGDLIPDLYMTENLMLYKTLTIGYYHEGGSYSLEKYKEAFDIVILNDGNLVWVNNLIKSLSHKK